MGHLSVTAIEVGATAPSQPAGPFAERGPVAALTRQGSKLLLWPTLATIVLITAGDFEIRRRDLESALGGGSLDAAILLELMAFGLVGAWLILNVARPPRYRRHSSLLIAMWVSSVILALSAGWAPSRNLALARAIQLLITAGLAHSVAARATRHDLHRLADAFVVVVTSWIALGIVVRRPTPLMVGRFHWLYTHPVTCGALLLVSVLILANHLGKGSNAPRLLPRRAYPLLFVTHLVALVATQTRGSLFALAAAGMAMAWSRAKGKRGDLILGLAAAIPVVVVVLGGAITSFIVRGEGTSNLRNLNSRTDLWSEALNIVKERPITGSGYFSAREVFLDSIGLGGSHNAYLEVLVSAGLLGMGAFLVLLVLLFKNLWRARRHADQPLLLALTVAMLVNGITAQYLAQSGTGSNVWFLLIVAWTVVIRRDTSPAATVR